MERIRTSSKQVGAIRTAVETSSDGRMTRRDVLALLAAFGVTSTVLAQDPVKMMPKNYRIVLENDVVRVIEYHNRPGLGPCGTGLHYHPRHIDIFMTDFRALVKEDGNIGGGQVKAGDVKWYEAGTHEVENIDKTASRMFMVEIKDANWKPSSG
jgi:hypothetical protein